MSETVRPSGAAHHRRGRWRRRVASSARYERALNESTMHVVAMAVSHDDSVPIKECDKISQDFQNDFPFYARSRKLVLRLASGKGLNYLKQFLHGEP